MEANIRFRTYGSFDEMMKAVRRARVVADARVQDWQAAIKVGDYFSRNSGYGFLIFGEIRECYREEHMRHYRFCMAYSVACPEGELGDIHVSTIERILAKEDFEEARERGWVSED